MVKCVETTFDDRMGIVNKSPGIQICKYPRKKDWRKVTTWALTAFRKCSSSWDPCLCVYVIIFLFCRPHGDEEHRKFMLHERSIAGPLKLVGSTFLISLLVMWGEWMEFVLKMMEWNFTADLCWKSCFFPPCHVYKTNFSNFLIFFFSLFCLFSSPPLTQFFLDCSGLVRTDKKPALCKSYQKLISELWHKKRYTHTHTRSFL